jgi:hypothetical protein
VRVLQAYIAIKLDDKHDQIRHSEEIMILSTRTLNHTKNF